MQTRRYFTLDAMRGVAALAVFAMHAGLLIEPLSPTHAFLAVDLFFLLSGVVIDRVYGTRIQAGLTPLEFFVNRYLRFYPLYLVGTTIGIACALAALLLGQGVLSPAEFGIAVATSAIMAPSPTSAADAFVVPFNYAAWSLIFELLINVIFVAVYRWLNVRTLVVITLLSAAAFTAAALLTGSVSMGAEWPNLWGGVPRVAFSFTVGVLISRLHNGQAIQTRWAYALAFAPICLFLPLGGVSGDIVKVLFVFPAVVVAALSLEPRGTDTSLAALLGMISYPLYAIHVPVLQFVERACTVLHVERSASAPFGGLALAAALCGGSLMLFRLDDRLQKRMAQWRYVRRQQRAGLTV